MVSEYVDQEQLASDVLNILDKHCLTFSERGIRLIIRHIKSYQSTVRMPVPPTIAEKRNQLRLLKVTASNLLNQVQKTALYMELSDSSQSLVPLLEQVVQECEYSLKKRSMKSGAPTKNFPLKQLAQNLILLFEKETGEDYVLDACNEWGRERTVYNPQADAYVISILEIVAPNEDPREVLKAVRRPPVPLDWVRKMQKIIDKEL